MGLWNGRVTRDCSSFFSDFKDNSQLIWKVNYKYINFYVIKVQIQLKIESKLAYAIACLEKDYQKNCKAKWIKSAINIERLRKKV